MKYTTLATAAAPKIAADYDKPHGRETLSGETYTITLVEFAEVQSGKLKFAILGDDQLAMLETAETFGRLNRNGYRSEASARREFNQIQNPKLRRW